MRARWVNKTPPLSPPASEAELAWWRSKRLKAGLRHGLMQAVPFTAVFTIVGIIRGRFGVHMFVTIPLLAILAAMLTWAAVEKHHRSQAVRWKRVREDLGVPNELP